MLKRVLLLCALMYAVRVSCGPNNLLQRSLNCGAKASFGYDQTLPELGSVSESKTLLSFQGTVHPDYSASCAGCGRIFNICSKAGTHEY